MLPKSSRLIAENDFNRLYKQGRRINGRYLRFFFQKLHDDTSRFGFVIAKKAIPLSSGRNRVKRILRDSISKVRTRIKSGYDVIIQGQGSSRTASPESLREEVTQFFQKSKLLS